MRKIDPILQERLEKLISSMGCEFVGCEMLPKGRGFLFRIYIDRETGATVEDCSQVSRQVGAMLDAEEVFQDKYTLEVSSPGIDRPLFTLDDFRRFAGKRAKLRMTLPIEGRRQFQGILLRVDGDVIYLRMDESEQEIKLPFSGIEKANLVGDICFQRTGDR